ncbi:uncharacterized protein LOC144652516 isoform X2 [Oculina patagonica]
MSDPKFNPEKGQAVVISLPRYHDQGHTSLVICLKICCDENKEIAGVSGKPTRLYDGDGSHIWSNEKLIDNNIQVGSIISYRLHKSYKNRRYLSNTGKKLETSKVLSLLHFKDDKRQLPGRVVCRSIKDAFSDAVITESKEVCQTSKTPFSCCLISISRAYVVGFRIVIVTQLGEEVNLSNHSVIHGPNLTEPIILPVQDPVSEEDVGDVVLVGFESEPAENGTYQAFCEGILLRTAQSTQVHTEGILPGDQDMSDMSVGSSSSAYMSHLSVASLSPGSPDEKQLKPSKVSIGPEALSEGAIKTETGSMDQMESASHYKSESRIKVELSHDRLETVSGTTLGDKSERCEVSERGGVWKLQEIQAAACITFPQNAVTKPVLFMCTLWGSTTNFPPLKKDEALVSRVIVLDYDDALNSNFTGDFDKEVTVALSHSASNLEGYEVVVRELIDPDNNDWKDLKTTNVWKALDVQQDPSSKPRVPFAEAKVTCCSAFAVICRLKSYTFSTNDKGTCDFTCKVQEYPDVSVTIPASVVHENRDFLLTLKVQEIPRQWFDDSGITAGPVLHITCSPAIHLGEPATITMPLWLQTDKVDFAEYSSKNVRVLVNSDEESSDWNEITDQLPRPADLTNGVVTFQATHFTRFSAWLEKITSLNVESLASRLTNRQPLEASFFACLCSTGCPGSSQLRFCCYPYDHDLEVRKSICSTYEVLRYGDTDSSEPLCHGDVIFVSLRNGLDLSEGTSKERLKLRFRADKKFVSDVVVRDPCGVVPEIEFFKHLDEKPPRDKWLCGLSIVHPNTQTLNRQRQPVKDGNPSVDELEVLSTRLGDNWEKLGRRLGFDQPELTAFERENARLSDRAYRMLMSWKQREGYDATYQVLYDALIHDLVACRLLAEEFCCT